MTNGTLVCWVARVALLVFGGWTALIVLEHGSTGFIDLALEFDWAAQLFVDLVIALTITMVWMVQDARKRGVAAWPYVVMTLFLGSIGPLLYLSLRSETDS